MEKTLVELHHSSRYSKITSVVELLLYDGRFAIWAMNNGPSTSAIQPRTGSGIVDWRTV